MHSFHTSNLSQKVKSTDILVKRRCYDQTKSMYSGETVGQQKPLECNSCRNFVCCVVERTKGFAMELSINWIGTDFYSFLLRRIIY